MGADSNLDDLGRGWGHLAVEKSRQEGGGGGGEGVILYDFRGDVKIVRHLNENKLSSLDKMHYFQRGKTFSCHR